MDTFSHRALGFVSTFVIASASVACGSSDNGGGTTGTDSGAHGDSSATTDSGVPGDSSTDTAKTDSGAGDTAKSDTTTTDAPTDTTTDAPAETLGETSADATDASDSGAHASGTKIVSGGFHVTSMTTDDYAVLANIDGTAGAQTIAIGGGSATSIDTASLLAFSSGKVVFSWDQDGTTFPMTGNLVAWSFASGAHAISSTALAPSRTLFATFAASRDGSAIVWLDNAATDGSTADIKWAHADGTGATTLFTSAAIPSDGSCNPILSPASTGFVLLHCDGTGGTTGAAHLDAIDASGVATSLSTDTQASFTLDGTGANILHVTGSGNVELITFAGVKTTIDSAGYVGLLSSSGALAVYSTTANALKKSATTSPAPSTLLSSGVLGPYSGTPSLGAVIYASDASSSSGIDLFLVDTTAGTPAGVSLAAVGDGGIFGDAFTADGTRAIYQTGIPASTYDLQSTVVATGTTTAVATNVWDEHGYGTGAKIVYGDNYTGGSGAASFGIADIHAVDLSATTLTPSSIADAAEVEIWVDSTKTKLVYAWNAVTGSEGVYVAPLP